MVVVPIAVVVFVVFAFSKNGRQTIDGRRKTVKQPLGGFIHHTVSSHVQGEKDGMCFLQGNVLEGSRRALAVTHLDFLVLDLDTGESIERAKQKLIELGLFGIIYTTHSHLKDTTDINLDALLRATLLAIPARVASACPTHAAVLPVLESEIDGALAELARDDL